MRLLVKTVKISIALSPSLSLSLSLSLPFSVSFSFLFISVQCYRCLEQQPQALVSMLRHINETFSKDSSDCISTLSTILELVRMLTTNELAADPEAVNCTRLRTLNRDQLALVVDWDPKKDHPLVELEVSF